MFNFFKKNENKIENSNPAPKAGFELLKNALKKTATSIVDSVLDVVGEEIDEYALDDIEAMLIKADIGVNLAYEIVEKIKSQNIKAHQLKGFLKDELSAILNKTETNVLKYDKDKLNIYLVVGVNGAGKTTLIGKLANKFKKDGNSVLLVAGDTFRAAAEEQLDIWAKRADVAILREDKADSASLAYRGIDLARKDNHNVVIIDTAGRLQNKFNLIEELKKIKNVISKKVEGSDNLETLLVLDGSQGQNGLSQANVFSQALDITACAITKLDGTPKGGMIFSIAKDLNIPTKLIGLGEKIEDIANFNKDEFISAIFD